MAAVGFGFSPSDVVLAVSLLTQVMSALKSDVAATEYRDTVQFLENLCLVLSHLQDLSKDAHSNPALANAISALSTTAERPLKDFIDEIQGFNEDFAKNFQRASVVKTLRRGAIKLEWSFLVKKKVDALRTRITAKMQGLHFLLESRLM
jgi:hypothetical protein